MTNDDPLRYAGEAALGLVESLLLHLVESGKLEPGDVAEIFDTLIEAHSEAALRADDPRHRMIVHLLEQVQIDQGLISLARR
jgi:hypothetical protein